MAEATGEPRAEDDAKALQVAAVDALPAPLCFDHGTILADYLRFRADGTRPPLGR